MFNHLNIIKILIIKAYLLSAIAFAVDKPNMLLYLSDDHSQTDMSLYGNPNIPTPNLEKIAEDALVFNHAYAASPACAPSRAALLTGLMPARNGAEENHTYPQLSEHIKSLVSSMQAQGYEVVAFGKVAHGKGNRLKIYGFDTIETVPGFYHPDNIQQIEKKVTHYLKNRQSDKPLCLMVGVTNPHVPWLRETSFAQKDVELPPKFLDTPATRQHRAMYYQQIKELDDFSGRLMDLKNQYMGQDSIFVHTSDHGSQWPFGKWTLYDYGTRVPLIFSWPGNIKSGTTDAMVSLVDLMPTLIDIAGGAADQSLDGYSFKTVLIDPKKPHREAIFTTTTGDTNKNIYPSRSIRTSEWKLIHNIHPEFAFTNHSDLLRRFGAGAYWNEWWNLAKSHPDAMATIIDYYSNPEFELYQMKKDKWELTNMINAPQYQNIATNLKSRLQNWMEAQHDTVKMKYKPKLLSEPKSWQPEGVQLSVEQLNHLKTQTMH
ncbi:sulfatase family protein [Catenovulum adriaticum]|uniref:Sulfatase n=1 Tax=Catenovulum adriaticum TaxID=2984846 RepID=A0ABY7ARE5_9ALTE|nr:sulfatase [Catenovulum sp. TS8]WAJ71837.1 sulfatase [Catenovulum sp. TS8]